MVIELRVLASGEFEFGYSVGLDSLSPARVVVDHGYRYPGHPLPGMPLPPAAANTGEPTDPHTLDTVGLLVAEYVALYAAVMGRPPQFAAGYTEPEIADAEHRMGLRMPDDLRALYRVIHDDVAEYGVLGQYCLVPLDKVVATYLDGAPGSSGWNDDLFTLEPVVFESHPPGRVRRVSRSDWWVTVASDNSGNYCAVDLDPAEAGTPGQLIEYGRDVNGPVGYLAPSVTVLLGQVVKALRAGEIWDPDPDDARLRPHPSVGAVTDRPSHTWSIAVADRDLAAAVTELDDPLAVQTAYLNDGNDLDLAALAPLRNLRAISINRAGRVRAALPGHLPVESLSLEAKSADLDQLARHSTIWDLTVGSLATPVDIELLATLPALARLDLSGVTVRNQTQMANLADLRVLALSQSQWLHLREADQIPTRLAAAELSGFTPLANAVEWANAITGRATPTAAPVQSTTIPGMLNQ